MSEPIVFMFSGQGSQYWDMGKTLYEQNDVFRNWMIELNDLVRFRTGLCILTHLYNPQRGRREAFNHLEYSHPAIFMVEYALSQTLRVRGITPDVIIGCSLGEFAAAAAAGVLDVETAVEWITEQARIIQDCCQQGNMLAVLHHASICEEAEIVNRGVELVSVNYDGHFVISGASAPMKEIQAFLQARGIVSELLPVLYGFHSPQVDPAEEACLRALQTQKPLSPHVKMISCVYGQAVSRLPDYYFWKAVRDPIQFRKGIEEIERLGLPVYVDLSPFSTLANFVRRNVNREMDCYSIMTPFHQELKNLDAVYNKYAITRR